MGQYRESGSFRDESLSSAAGVSSSATAISWNRASMQKQEIVPLQDQRTRGRSASQMEIPARTPLIKALIQERRGSLRLNGHHRRSAEPEANSTAPAEASELTDRISCASLLAAPRRQFQS